MKKVVKLFLCFFIALSLSGCYFNNYDYRDIEDMSLIELNLYNKDLKEDNEDLNSEYQKYQQAINEFDLEKIINVINYVNHEVIKSNVMITNESKSFFHTTSVSSGSGTIIKEDSNYYYVLTNNHVIYSLGNRSTYYIYDYLNNEYSATVLFSDPDYDMALLKFRKSITLKVAELAENDVEVDGKIIAIGQPFGQRNAITFGKVLKYERVTCSDCNINESNINYDCVFYDAETTNGNSGGMIVNSEYQLVGVVTYGMTDHYGKYIYGAGSPISKVKEFLANNDFIVGDSNE